MIKDQPATITYRGETRETTVTVIVPSNGDQKRVYADKALVATIGRGSAKYPASVAFWPLGDRKVLRQHIVVETEGETYVSTGTCVARNRTALVSGWAELATNAQDQTRL